MSGRAVSASRWWQVLVIVGALALGGCGGTASPTARAANDLTAPGSRATFTAADAEGDWAEIVVERGRTLDEIADPRAQAELAEGWIEMRATYVVTASRDGKPVGALADWYAYQRTSRGMGSVAILFNVSPPDRNPLLPEFGGVHRGDRLDGWFYVPVLEGDFTEIWLGFAQRETGESSWTEPDWDTVETRLLLQR